MTDDPILDRSKEQKLERISKLRGELHDLGYSVVTTKWLDVIYDHIDPQVMDSLNDRATK